MTTIAHGTTALTGGRASESFLRPVLPAIAKSSNRSQNATFGLARNAIDNAQVVPTR